MSTDRTVYWADRKPTPDQVRAVIEDFFGSAGDVWWSKDRWYVTLPGVTSEPLARVRPVYKSGPRLPTRERWLEVWEDADRTCLSVITRQQDESTSAVAVGLVAVFARYWQATVEGGVTTELRS